MVAEREGKVGEQLQAIEDDWLAQAGLKRFDEAVLDAIATGSFRDPKALAAQFKARTAGKQLSNTEARVVAREILGRDIFFDWDAPQIGRAHV